MHLDERRQFQFKRMRQFESHHSHSKSEKECASTTESNTQMQYEKIVTRSSIYQNDPHCISHTVKESFLILKISVNKSAHVSEVQ